MQLNNKNILVVGASSHIGEKIVLECANLGASLIATKFSSTKNNICSYSNVTIPLHTLDITNPNNIDAFAKGIAPINGLVCSVGSPMFMAIKNENYDTITLRQQTGFVGVASLVTNLLRQKKLKENSSIVFISSISGNMIGMNGGCIYSATKAALCGFAKSLSVELAPLKIRVNCICAGIIDTPKLHQLFTEKMIESFINTYPLKRLGTVNDIAKATSFLLSDDSSWITGTQIVIDGGYSIV